MVPAAVPAAQLRLQLLVHARADGKELVLVRQKKTLDTLPAQATLQQTPALQPDVKITAETLKKLEETQPNRPWWEMRSVEDFRALDPASDSGWTPMDGSELFSH